MTMYSDYYGKALGDAILHSFTRTLMKHYGDSNTYTNGSDEILCLIQDMGMADCLGKGAECRKETHAFTHEGIQIALTFAMGCVSGVPESDMERRVLAGSVPQGRDGTEYLRPARDAA